MSLVFPSSVAADFWARECLFRGWLSSVDMERFLSWDRFKEACFGAEGACSPRPASAELRLLFSADLLRRNAERPFLSEILPLQLAGDWAAHLPALAASLPSLKRFAERADRSRLPLARDYAAVMERYAAFLLERGFREPSWERTAFDPRGRRWLIAYPELIEDYQEYTSMLSGHPSIREVHVPAPAARPPVRVLPGLAEEIDWVLGLVERAASTTPEGLSALAITCPGAGRLRPYLEREARLRGIDLDFRAGAPLASYPGGRIFPRLKRLVDGAFAIEDMRDILMDACLPWREAGAAKGLLDLGMRLTVRRGWREGERDVDAWEAAFRCEGSAADEAVVRFYRGLRSQARALAEADGFPALKKAWNAFSASMLDRAAMPMEADRVVARCVAAMDDLGRAQAEGGFDAVPGAFGILCGLLSRQPYLGAEGRGGLRVYDYRVSAGIEPRLHFILNASEEGLSVRGGACLFLREDQRQSLGLDGRDMSADFIAAYAASGENVAFSCSERGLDGFQNPHGALDETALSDAGQDCPGPRDFRLGLDAFFAMDAAFPARLSPALAAGLRAACAASLREPARDWTVSGKNRAMFKEAGQEALRHLRRSRDDGLLRISPSMLKVFSLCPLAWLWDRVLDAGKRDEGLAVLDERFIGDTYHRFLEDFYGAIHRIAPLTEEELSGLLTRAASKATALVYRQRGPLARIIAEMSLGDYIAVGGKIYILDLHLMPGAEVEAVECQVEAAYPERGIVLEGRLDRLMRLDGPQGGPGLVLIDYKTRGTLSRKEFAPLRDDEGTMVGLADFQFPIYALILKKNGQGLAGALVFSLRGREYRSVAGGIGTEGRKKSFMALSELDEAADLALALASAAAERVLAMDYGLAERGLRPQVCPDCAARNLCRERYNVR